MDEQQVMQDPQADTQAPEQAVTQPAPVLFEYADFKIECGKCGAKHTLFANDQGGRKMEFTVYATDKHEFKMECNDCGNFLRVFYEEAENPPVEEVTEADEQPNAESNPEAISEDSRMPKEEETIQPEDNGGVNDGQSVQEESKTEEQVS